MSKLRDMRMAARKRPDWSAFTIGQLSQVLGVTAPTYYRIERHPEKLTYDQAARLARHYQCEVGDLFCPSE